jgi:hypothetical protein
MFLIIFTVLIEDTATEILYLEIIFYRICSIWFHPEFDIALAHLFNVPRRLHFMQFSLPGVFSLIPQSSASRRTVKTEFSSR